MHFDTAVPEKLKKKQIWFASVITRPIDDESRINPVGPSGRSMEEEAKDYIAPSPTLEPIERIQIYNQQFWWRLLNTLHEEFPLVTRLFGYREFNEKIGIPYIETFLPNHWSLSFLGNRLSRWVNDNYNADDKKLVSDAVKVDWAFNYGFIAAHYTPFGTVDQTDSDRLSSLMNNVVYLQPHIQLFALKNDLFQLREEFLEYDPDYWLENDFPKIRKDGTYYFVFFRDLDNQLCYEEIAEGEYMLLRQFSKGSKLEEAINWMENQGQELKSQASEHLHRWIQKWIVEQWLTPDSKAQRTQE